MKLSVRPGRIPLLALMLPLSLLLGEAFPSSPSASPWTPPRAQAQPLPSGSGQVGFVPGQLLLKLKGNPPEVPAFEDLYPEKETLGTAGVPAHGGYGLKGSIAALGVLRLEVPAGRELEAVERLRDDPRVEWAEPDYLREETRTPDDQLYRQFQWGLRKIQAEQAWELTTGDSGVVVAVLDTGIDPTHPDLAGKLVKGYDFLNDDPDPDDDSGHGTFNAGLIGAASNNQIGIVGVAWGARIMPIKVLNSKGVGPNSVVAQGIVYAADHGARVINMSFGNPITTQVEAEAIRYAHNRGAILVAAAGNTANLDNAVIYPAAHPQVLAVAATDEEDEVPDFSQHHPYVGVSAPGAGILSTFWREAGYGDYASASGTSAAAPHVSGLAALVLSVNPRLTNDQVKRILQETADDLGVPGRDEYYGAGRINAYKAVLAARATLAGPAAATPTPAAGPTPTPFSTPSAAPSRTQWYFAEGSTARPFDLWLLLQNPNGTAATAKVTYMKRDGSQVGQEVMLPPVSRRSIFVNQLIPEAEISMKVESDSPVLAERAMYFRTDGHVSAGVPAPSTRWYMAEGSTRGDFDSWILLQNPQNSQANVTLTFLTSEGRGKEIVQGLPPTSRLSLHVNQLVPDAEVSTVISSDQPIIAERAMYFRQVGGHGSPGANQLARSWYLAEGRVGQGLDSWLLAMNPNATSANLKVTYMGEAGNPIVGYYAVPAASRLSIYMNQAVPKGKWGAKVESDQPIVVERSTYFAGGRGGHNVAATPQLSQEWYLPEGSTKQPFTEEVAILNPSDRPARLVVTFMKGDGTVESHSFAANPTSRLTLRVNDLVPEAEVSTGVTSDTPIAVERSMYFANGLGGTDAFGIAR